MKRDAPFFDNNDPRLIYIAKRLDDSLRLECVLTESGVDFGVEADRYRGGMIFRTDRVGAFFYVLPEAEAQAREILQRVGFRPYQEE
ncbi:MAG: hypothetical protein M3Z85_13910 [Acidobacteriota bacterium]|nr:hypothetical protein [Acidobacteriota bacterium]